MWPLTADISFRWCRFLKRLSGLRAGTLGCSRWRHAGLRGLGAWGTWTGLQLFFKYLFTVDRVQGLGTGEEKEMKTTDYMVDDKNMHARTKTQTSKITQNHNIVTFTFDLMYCATPSHKSTNEWLFNELCSSFVDTIKQIVAKNVTGRASSFWFRLINNTL